MELRFPVPVGSLIINISRYSDASDHILDYFHYLFSLPAGLIASLVLQ